MTKFVPVVLAISIGTEVSRYLVSSSWGFVGWRVGVYEQFTVWQHTSVENEMTLAPIGVPGHRRQFVFQHSRFDTPHVFPTMP